jgi:NADH-quinone oxidoreductase subunit L
LPLWVELSPFIAMLIGFVAGLVVLHPLAGNAGEPGASSIAGSTSSCSTSGISTSSTTSCSCVPPSASAISCGRPATARIIDGHGPDGISARVVDVTNRVVKLQTGYLYHYAFAMLIGVAALVTWMMLGSF